MELKLKKQVIELTKEQEKGNEKMKKTNYDIIKELDKQDIFDCLYVADYIDEQEINELSDIDDIIDYLDDIIDGDNVLIQESEVIYYSEAIKILGEYDPSFEHALNIASEHGYTIEDVNSELLASLIMWEQAQDDFIEYKDALREALEQKESN